MSTLFSLPEATTPMPLQSEITFPIRWVDKYCPQSIEAFAGIADAKAIARSLIHEPRQSNWLFVGEPGLGKTTLAFAIANMLPAELHHVPSQQGTVDRFEQIHQRCQSVPMDWFGGRKPLWHLVLADEINRASKPAQYSLYSKLDGTNPFLRTIFIATCNSTEELEPALLSRFIPVKFSNYGMAKPTVKLLADIWEREASHLSLKMPNFARTVKEANNNARAAINALECEFTRLKYADPVEPDADEPEAA